MNWNKFVYGMAIQLIVYGLISYFVEPTVGSFLLWLGFATFLSWRSANR